MKQKQTRLKVEFKQFQRLPDWLAIVRTSDAKRSLEDASARKVRLSPPLLEEDRLGMRSLVE